MNQLCKCYILDMILRVRLRVNEYSRKELIVFYSINKLTKKHQGRKQALEWGGGFNGGERGIPKPQSPHCLHHRTLEYQNIQRTISITSKEGTLVLCEQSLLMEVINMI